MNKYLVPILLACSTATASDLSHVEVERIKATLRLHETQADLLATLSRGKPGEHEFSVRAQAMREAIYIIEMTERPTAPAPVVVPAVPAPKPSTTIKWRTSR